MPNIAALLKSEISRVARKEIRTETASTKKASTAHRAEIAALKRRLLVLERQIRELAKTGGRRVPAVEPELASTPGRFSSKGLTSLRRRLGLSAHALGLLIGSSSQSVYNWEDGTTRPQAKYLAAIAFVKTRSKTQIAARLRELQT